MFLRLTKRFNNKKKVGTKNQKTIFLKINCLTIAYLIFIFNFNHYINLRKSILYLKNI